MQYEHNEYLAHHGVKGQRWGVRRYTNRDGSLNSTGKRRYSSTSLQGAIARRQNQKVDKSFQRWKTNASNRDQAIELGKKANASRRAYESDRHNKEKRKQYKADNKAYKKALRKNTTYHKGTVKQEVHRDASRSYLSDARRINKELKAHPNDRNLQRQYDKAMSRHDVERARGRRVQEQYAKSSRRNAALKAGFTRNAKRAAIGAGVAVGLYAANKYLSSHNVTINGERVSVGQSNIDDLRKFARAGRRIIDFGRAI